ncbi:hypothetical protein K439DRAFT_1412365 [Ramaria rubella]|nr:hypothetical protein K439DRAFT_1412365 [Ramaria rubella]
MIGKSLPEYLFIRFSIFLLRTNQLRGSLRSTHVIASLYTAARLVTSGIALSLPVECWLFAECLFYFLVYLPRHYYLQRPAIHPPIAPRAHRIALFNQCVAYLPNFDRFTKLWFRLISTTTIKRDNYIDWILWALFSTDRDHIDIHDPTLNEEVNGYINVVERLIGHKIEAGRNPSIEPMRITLDPVVTLHRPLVWYAIVAIVDLFTYMSLHQNGFKHYSLSPSSSFPPRLQGIISKRSLVNIPYWYRPHKSPDKRPVVMLHGIGIGLYPYVPFLVALKRIDPEVGILALEILPISMRITHAMFSQEQFIEQLIQILDHHKMNEFILVSHSYGSVLTNHILRSSLASRVASIILVDPVTFLLHLGDVAYNFIYREPRTANQWQLWYFASRDIGVSHTLSRHFFWGDNIMFKEDLKGRKVGVLLSGEDQIVDTKEVWKYLTGEKDTQPAPIWRSDEEDLSVLWFPRLDHAQIFDKFESRRSLLELLKQ